MKLLEQLPQFWQGVLASIVAAIVFAMAARLYAIYSAQFRRTREQYEREVSALQTKLASPDSVIRAEGYLIALFTLMKYLFVGNIAWILGSLAGLFFPGLIFPVDVGLVLIGLLIYYQGLRWIQLAVKTRENATPQ